VQTGQASAIMIAAAEATTAGNLPTRGSAQRAIEQLRALDADATAAVEEIEAAGNFRAAGRDATAKALARSLENVINRAAALPTERTFILQESVPPIRLAYELYGDLERLDQFIEYNDFAGNELLVIPRGREVRWYE
jgi:prophage DNA circulation protein